MSEKTWSGARFAHGPGLNCGIEGCSHGNPSTGMRKVGAPIPPPLPNPTGGDTWYHGTSGEFYNDPDVNPNDDDDDPIRGGRIEPPLEGGMEYGENSHKHWNTDLGAHFTSVHHTAEAFATGTGAYSKRPSPESRILHAGLHMANPKHYDSEEEMGRDAVAFAHSKGIHFLPHEKQHGREVADAARQAFEDGDYDEIYHPEGHQYGYLHDHDLDRSDRLSIADMSDGKDYPDHHVDQYIGLHPLRDEITEGFREHLKKQGHDGITYGNDLEPPLGHTCAIAFPDTVIHHRKWQWLHPSKFHLNDNGAQGGQDQTVHPNQVKMTFDEKGNTYYAALDAMSFFKQADRDMDCPQCDGSGKWTYQGSDPNFEPREHECRDCGGTGRFNAADHWDAPTLPKEQVDAYTKREGESWSAGANRQLDFAKHPVPGTHIWRGEIRHKDDLDNPPSIGMHWTTTPEMAIMHSHDDLEPDQRSVLWEARIDDPDNQIIPRSHPIWYGKTLSLDSEKEVRLQPGSKIHVTRALAWEGGPRSNGFPYPAHSERSAAGWVPHKVDRPVDVDHKSRYDYLDYSKWFKQGAAMDSLDEVAKAGYNIDGWDRWQQGNCGTYAHALIKMKPDLKFGVAGTKWIDEDGWSVEHIFAHDKTHAYDSAGKHPLPYYGVHNDMDYNELDQDEDDWSPLQEEGTGDREVAEAQEHAKRHGILEGRYGLRQQKQGAADTQCACCGGSGEHTTGRECYGCDASGLASAFEGDMPCDGTKPYGVDNEGHQVELDPSDGWQHLDGSVSHDDGTTITDHPVTINGHEYSPHQFTKAHPFLPTHKIFGEAKTTLDPRLFMGDTMKPEVRDWIMARIGSVWYPLYHGWQQWARIYLAGSEATYWWGNNDLDTLIGIQHDLFRSDNPEFDQMSDTEIDQMLTQQFRETINNEDAHVPFDPKDEVWHTTFFVNPNSWDIRKIKPYGAYEIISAEWYVRPPDVPKNWGPQYWDESTWDHAEATLGLIDSIRKLPEPDRSRQGAMLYEALHADRSRAFSANGYGWTDPGNVVFKWLDLEPSKPLEFLIQCAHDASKMVTTAGYAEYLRDGWTDNGDPERGQQAFEDYTRHPYFHESEPWTKQDKVGWVKTEAMMPYREYDRGDDDERGSGGAHSRRVIDAIKDDLQPGGRGWGNPIMLSYDHGTHSALIDEGNHRMAAAHEMGLEYVPITVNRAYRSAVPDHKPAQWDRSAVRTQPNEHNYVPGQMHPHEILPPEMLHPDSRYQPPSEHTAMGANGPDYKGLTFDHHQNPDAHMEGENSREISAHHFEHGEVGTLSFMPKNAQDYPAEMNEPWDAVEIGMLHVPYQHQRRGVASALMDELHRYAPGAWIEHGERSNDGEQWARGYFKDQGEDGTGYKHASLDEGEHSLYRGLYMGDLTKHIWHPHDRPCPACGGEEHGVDADGNGIGHIEYVPLDPNNDQHILDDLTGKGDYHQQRTGRETEPINNRAPMYGSNWTGSPRLALQFALDSQHGHFRSPPPPHRSTYGIVLEAHSKTPPEGDPLGSQYGETQVRWPGRDQITGVTMHLHHYDPDHPDGHRQDTHVRSFEAPEQHWKTAAKAIQVSVAGVVIKAEDTGRILLLQRSFDDEEDPAKGKWEAPGGHMEDGETPFKGGKREWCEETGSKWPSNGFVADNWVAPNGIYQGFVVVIPKEDGLEINLDNEDRKTENPDQVGDKTESLAWFEIEDLAKNPAMRKEFLLTPWKVLEDATLSPSKDSKTHKANQQITLLAKIAAEDYRMDHQGPDPDSGAPMHDLTGNGIYPADVYDVPHQYVYDPMDWEGFGAARRTRNKPEKTVMVYRAVPHGVKTINPGDWVTPSKDYARREGMDACPGCGKNMQVIYARAKAKHLHTEGNSLSEWAYNGPEPLESWIRSRKCLKPRTAVHEPPDTEYVMAQMQLEGLLR
jgi:8-oxo-dGTP pyrophosphatase MutT (NUDIX family)